MEIFMRTQVVNAVDTGATVQTVYVPAHLYHILFELFKNALRATVEVILKFYMCQIYPPDKSSFL